LETLVLTHLGFRARFTLGFTVLLAILVPTYLWISRFVEDGLLDVLVFILLLALTSTIVARIFRWEPGA
jgi:hypothetical protein